jgi:pyridoxine 4-dehydrogenase
MKLVKEVEQVAQEKGVTPAQVALAWIRTLSGRDGFPIIIPIPGATMEARVLDNSRDLRLTDDEMAAVDQILAGFRPKGERYGRRSIELVNG